MTHRAASVQATVLILSTGVVLLVLGVGPRIEPAAASPLSWVAIVGGTGLILGGLVVLGMALSRSERPTCPHCSAPVEVNVETWSGRIRLDKRGGA